MQSTATLHLNQTSLFHHHNHHVVPSLCTQLIAALETSPAEYKTCQEGRPAATTNQRKDLASPRALGTELLATLQD
ncbi:hypothetical protein CBOM_08092 [Ceraceosorus bombacis]|uniref:Uncharacterized protein n=1 Tax=Ceraceosorus bombacis TaxID=401625 RepID=A0A0P1B828_9BASI|nr:hypothetical protein CBOM_08092 [Ceraceosorus bombacis]